MTEAQANKRVNIIMAVAIGCVLGLICMFIYCRITPVEKSVTYYNGQQLLPDYVHDDTLRVYNAEYLNDKVSAAYSDGSIMELLNETCETEQEYWNNQ